MGGTRHSSASEPIPVNALLSARVAAVYDRPDTLDGDRSSALGLRCPAAESCWGESRDPHRTCGTIFTPWIGERYRPGGVCVVGLNLRIGEGDGTYWHIERSVATKQLRALLAGRRRSDGSRWASATMRDAALVLRDLHGHALDRPISADELGTALLSTARVQAVKCSPGQRRGTPFRAMPINCPPLYLLRELDVLRPGVLLVYGRAAASAIRRLGKIEAVQRQGTRFRRIEMRLGGLPYLTMFAMTHPAHSGWPADHLALRATLQDRSLGADEQAGHD